MNAEKRSSFRRADAEAESPGFDISSWYGLWLPKDTPKNITTKLNAAVIEALADPMGLRLDVRRLDEPPLLDFSLRGPRASGWARGKVSCARSASRASEVDPLNGEVPFPRISDTLLRCIIFSGRKSGVGQNRTVRSAVVCLLSPGADMVRERSPLVKRCHSA